MVALQRSGKGWEESIDAAFDVSPEELAEKVDAHAKSIAHGAPGTVALIPVEELEIRHSSQIRELSEAEAGFYLGEIAMRGVILSRSDTRSGRLAEAILLKAREFDPTEPRIEAALALCLAQQRRFQEAQNHLDALPPMKDLDVDSLLFAARTMQLKSTSLAKSSKTDEQWTEQNELARRFFQEAIQKNRDSPHAYAGLGRAQFAAGKLNRARDSMAKARSLGEWDAELTLEQGRLAEKMAKKGLARAFWSEVIELGTDAETEQAAALISRLDADPVESDSTEDERMDGALGQHERD
jgi:Flp pilus assembly protein TadD